MHKLLERLHRDHGNLTRVLDLLTLQLDHFFAGEESNFDLKIEMLEYLESYADQSHHPLEDRIFTQWLARAPEKSELVERLRDQHKNLHRLTHTFRQSLENIMSGAVMSRQELDTQGREFVALQRQHLDLEETEAFAVINEVLTEDDWQEISADQPSKEDPLFALTDVTRFQLLFKYLTDYEASDRIED